jgi:hypothetical protein
MKNLRLYVVDANRPTTRFGNIVYAVSSDCAKSLAFYKEKQGSDLKHLDDVEANSPLFFSSTRRAVAMLEYVEKENPTTKEIEGRFFIVDTAETRLMCEKLEKQASRKLSALTSAFLPSFSAEADKDKADTESSAPEASKPTAPAPRTRSSRNLK